MEVKRGSASPSEIQLVLELDEATLKKLDEAIQNWDNRDSEVRKHFEESQEKWAVIIQPLVEAISASERLAYSPP